MLSRKLNLFSDAFVAIDGSKFRAVNNRNRNFSKAKLKKRLQQIDASIERYLGEIASADRREGEGPKTKTERLEKKIAALKEEIQTLKKLGVRMLAAPDQQLSQTDPDARVMSTAARSKAIVGYNVQAAVDTTHHLIVAHEVTNVGHDRSQLARMAKQAKDVIDSDGLYLYRQGRRVRMPRR
jgi:lipid II:glycine glycyltransferase (peptidoglycan interpeptide bridge formation enzyme)